MALPDHLSLKIPPSDYPRVVIVGGGFGGLQLARDLKNKKMQVVLLDRNNYHTFQPLLYQVATAGLEPDSIARPLRQSFAGHGDFYFRMVKVTGLDLEKQEVQTPIGNLYYNYLILACGSVTNYFGLDEVASHAFPLKKVVHALDLRSHILQNFEQSVLTDDRKKRHSLINIAIVGGGPTGVEVAGALAELKKHVLPKDFPDIDFSTMQIYLVEGASRLLGGMSPASGDRALRYLKKMGVTVVLDSTVKHYDGKIVYMGGNTELPCQTLIWAAGVKGNLVEGLPVEAIARHRVTVDDYNRVKPYPNVFAIGDLALMETEEFPAGHPMVAPVAIQQGKLLAKNLTRLNQQIPLRPFKYKDKGSMATVGRNRAVVDLPGGLRFGGWFAWLVWMFIHLISLIGFRNKIVTLINWMWSYITYDKGSRLIIRTFKRKAEDIKTPA